MDAQTLFTPLILRYGEETVQRWVGMLGTAQIAALSALDHLSRSKGETLMPDAVGLVLRFPSENPEGACGVVGLSSLGQMPLGQRQALLARAVECLSEFDLLPLPEEVEKRAEKKPEFSVLDGGKEDIEEGAEGNSFVRRAPEGSGIDFSSDKFSEDDEPESEGDASEDDEIVCSRCGIGPLVGIDLETSLCINCRGRD